MISQKGGIFMFLRAQLSAQMATIADFLVTILLVRLFEVYYVYATLAGAIMEESSIVLSTINGPLNRRKENECRCKVYPCMDLQRLVKHVGYVCTDGIISEDFLGTRHA